MQRKRQYKKTEELHVKRITLRFTEDEYRRIKSSAEGFRSVSQYARTMLLSEKKMIIDPRSFLLGTKEIVSNINKVGVNINQIAKYINIVEKTNVVDYSIILKVREELQNYISILEDIKQSVRDIYTKI